MAMPKKAVLVAESLQAHLKHLRLLASRVPGNLGGDIEAVIEYMERDLENLSRIVVDVLDIARVDLKYFLFDKEATQREMRVLRSKQNDWKRYAMELRSQLQAGGFWDDEPDEGVDSDDS